MNMPMIKAIVILPGTALVYAPALILWLTSGGPWAARLAESALMWFIALLFAAPGLTLMIWTVGLFARRGGGGSPAPWDPIRNFIAVGPYRHVRNPMLIGVILMLVAMSAALKSWPLLGWAVFFVGLNTVYFIKSEEPGLERRYGETYRRYKAAVPRWIPRLAPYDAGSPENQP